MTLIAHYRQWKIPVTPTDGQYNRQTYRYDSTINMFETILKDNNDIITVGDDNIDTLKDNNIHNNYGNYELKDMRQQFLINNNLTLYNFKPTFCRNALSSFINHIYPNCSHKIKNVTTQNNILSDNYTRTFNYNNKHLDIKPTY